MKQLTLLPTEKAKRDTVFEARLRQHRDWMTALDLCNGFGISQMFTTTDAARREIRLWASKSTRVISDQKGYKHIANATEDEVKHFVAWMRSQAIKMMTRARDVEDEFMDSQ